MLSIMKSSLSEAKKHKESAEKSMFMALKYRDDCKNIREAQVGGNCFVFKQFETTLTQIENLIYLMLDGLPSIATDLLEMLSFVEAQVTIARREIELERNTHHIVYGNPDQVYAAMNFLDNHGESEHAAYLTDRSSDQTLSYHLRNRLNKIAGNLSEQPI